MPDIADLIEAFCEDRENCVFYPDYSGRGMFGRLCVGIVIHDGVYGTLVQLCDFLHEHGIEEVSSVLGSISSDSLGMDKILYFQGVQKRES